MPDPSVDDYVQQRVRPELRPVAERVRQVMRELAPKAIEKISYNMPVYAGRHIFAYFNASKTHITLSFTLGAGFEDKHGLLRGKAKHARFLKLKRVEDVNKTVLRYYVRQALAEDKRRAQEKA
jgi:hypothetical protein